MGCGCGASRVTSTPSSSPAPNFVQAAIDPADCQYTMAQFEVWLAKLICCKDKRLYVQLGISASTMNRYLGIVMSALNYRTSPCYFQADLGPISDFIILLTNTGQC
jgi:hypothetical protein